jgi:hypothetical protein
VSDKRLAQAKELPFGNVQRRFLGDNFVNNFCQGGILFYQSLSAADELRATFHVQCFE